MHVLTFDIETIPDLEAGRRLYDLSGLADEDVARVMFHRRRQTTGGSEFLPLHLHHIVAISVALRSAGGFRLWSLGSLEANEAELVSRFFEGIDKYSPDLVSWNGGSFDLPVLHYRALVHGITASRYWETGDDDRSFRYNNYLGRFHWRHTDVMDVLAGYQLRSAAPLDQIALMLGLPGKLGMHGSQVWEYWWAGKLDEIRNYCETDVLNTYLVYLRFQLMRGQLERADYARECGMVRDFLQSSDRAHLQAFNDTWRAEQEPGSTRRTDHVD